MLAVSNVPIEILSHFFKKDVHAEAVDPGRATIPIPWNGEHGDSCFFVNLNIVVLACCDPSLEIFPLSTVPHDTCALALYFHITIHFHFIYTMRCTFNPFHSSLSNRLHFCGYHDPPYPCLDVFEVTRHTHTCIVCKSKRQIVSRSPPISTKYQHELDQIHVNHDPIACN